MTAPPSSAKTPTSVKVPPSAKGAKPYANLVSQYSGIIDPRVALMRIQKESSGNPKAKAPAQKWQTGFGSELGLLQLSPDTRKQYKISNEQAFDPATNIRIGMDVWNKWSKSFFGKETPKNPVTRNVWSWLVTAVGPGAARKLRDMSDGYDLDSLLKTANDMEALQKNRKYWGSQSPRLVSQRVRDAVRNVVGAMGAK